MKLMRFVLAIGWLLVPSQPSSAVAAEPVVRLAGGTLVSADLLDAYREYLRARHQLLHYRQVALPQQRMLLDQAQRSLRLEKKILQRRLADYWPALEIGNYSPVRSAAENDLLALQSVEQELEFVRDRDIQLMRFNSQADELHQFDVLRAALRVRAAHAAMGQ